jgi:hypothetical protein
MHLHYKGLTLSGTPSLNNSRPAHQPVPAEQGRRVGD